MNLKEKLMEDLKKAMKEKEVVKKGVLTLLRAGIVNLEKEKKRELTSVEELEVLRRELKQTNQSLGEYKKANREDLVINEKEKIVIIESYLPKQLSEEEIKEIVVSLGVKKGDAMGNTMKLVLEKINGRADGKMVSKVVKEILT